LRKGDAGEEQQQTQKKGHGTPPGWDLERSPMER
jgi:hypothetical protein